VTELLLVDDDQALRHWAERVTSERGYSCEGTDNAQEARMRLRENTYELVLLDVHIPGESGMGLLSYIRASYPHSAVVMLTGEDDPQLAMSAIELGAYGYMVKPVRSGELLINVANALHRRRRELESERVLEQLRATVDQRSQRLEETLQDLQLSETKVWVSQAETILRLARLVEFRDEETGHHLQRMSAYCELLARGVGLGDERCELIRLSSQLHDVGKVAVPDSILLKQGKLTPEEFEIIKSHAETGYMMLAGSASEVVQMGALIARTHHERWDGSGYPRGLAGDDIPIEGRIAAVADVFDALTSDRVYRSAFPVTSAVELMHAENGSHFQPELLETFFAQKSELDSIRRQHRL
jgi:putative two-component system response regulator